MAQMMAAGDWTGIAANARYSSLANGMTTYLPGSTVSNLLIRPGTEGMVTQVGSITVNVNTFISQLLTTAGCYVAAVCTSIPGC